MILTVVVVNYRQKKMEFAIARIANSNMFEESPRLGSVEFLVHSEQLSGDRRRCLADCSFNHFLAEIRDFAGCHACTNARHARLTHHILDISTCESIRHFAEHAWVE